MLKRFKKRKAGSVSRSPKVTRDQPHRIGYPTDAQVAAQHPHQAHQPISPTYETPYPPHAAEGVPVPQQMLPGASHQQFPQYQPNVDNIWRGFEQTSNEQLPVWLSDQTLGGTSFSQNGIDAFLLPTDYLPPATQIW